MRSCQIPPDLLFPSLKKRGKGRLPCQCTDWYETINKSDRSVILLRLSLLTVIISGLAALAFKDWYKSLCGLILLMAVVEHPDMPKSILGVQGLNPWNILLVIVMLGWVLSRRRENLRWDMPNAVAISLIAYFLVMVISNIRMLTDVDSLVDVATILEEESPTAIHLFSENFINSIKWVIPGLLIFDGCRSSERFYMGIFTVLGVYFLLSAQVIRWMPLDSALSGENLTERSLKLLMNEIGYHRVNLSMMLAGAMWAVLAASYLTQRPELKAILVVGSLTILLAQALTGGRAGYATWAFIGFFLCLFRFRKFLLIIPLVIFLVFEFVPGAYERMTQGFTAETRDVNKKLDTSQPSDELDLYTITAGRNIAWPYVLDKIKESPLVGHGRLAMKRTGISSFLMTRFGESFPHPHNAYLELLLDNGVVGALPVLLFYFIVVKYSASLFMDSRNRLFIAIGGAALALVGALLVASIGSQTFYPREGAVGMWCMIGLMLRVHVQRSVADVFVDKLIKSGEWRAALATR
jgi:O-antigen ligase